MALGFAEITDRLRDTGGARWAVHQRCRALRKTGRDIIELTIGEPDVLPDSSLIETAGDAMKKGRVGYSNGRGEPGLLEALAELPEFRRRKPRKRRIRQKLSHLIGQPPVSHLCVVPVYRVGHNAVKCAIAFLAEGGKELLHAGRHSGAVLVCEMREEVYIHR